MGRSRKIAGRVRTAGSRKIAGRVRTAGIAAALFLTVFLVPLYAGGDAEHSGRDAGEKTQNGDTLRIFVSILPQKYFVDRIAGDRAEVTVMVPPGRNPSTYEPTPRQVTELGSGDLFFTIGVPFEDSFIPSIKENLPDLRIVDTSKGIEKRSIRAATGEDVNTEEKEDQGDDNHDHSDETGMPDPHIWMSPPLVKTQAENMLEALVSLVPEYRDEFKSNFADFAEDLESLDSELRELLEPVKGSPLLVYHPAFGYFAETYGLRQIPVELGGNEPTPRELRGLISTAKEKGVRVIFVQPEFSKTSARRVAEAIGGAVVEVAPLKEDYLENMRHIANEVRRGILR
ncbi:MAG: metal ABC transporter solute-binding protein, Zn/Mn family [Spirochaetaceae bacterium]